MVLSIQAKKNQSGTYSVWYDVAREKTEIDVIEWAQRGEELGAGEILLTSIDHEGLERGMDTELIKLVSNAVNIPVIASGGLGKSSHFVEAIHSGADAVAIAKALHYNKVSVEEIKLEARNNNIKVR